MIRCLVLLAACGRVDFEPTPDATSRTCGPWSTPQAITAVNSFGDDWEPELSPDGKWLVFSSDRTTDQRNHLYLSANFGQPQPITALTTTAHDESPAWSGDGTSLYFASDRTGQLLLYQASFDGANFGAPQQIATLAGQAIVSEAVSADDLELVWGDTFDGTTSIIESVTRDSPAVPWPDQEQLFGELSPAGWPTLSADRLTILFARDAPGTIYTATRPSLDHPFATPLPVAGIGSPGAGDGDPFLSHDGTTLIFSSNRAGGAGLFDLYIATRACL